MSSFPISISWQVQTPPTASFDQLAKSAQSLDQAMASSAGKFDQFGQTVSQLESPLGSVSGSMGELGSSMSGLEGSLGSAAGSMGEFAGATGELNGAIGETGGFITEASGSMTELSGSTAETGGAMTELSGTTGEFNTSISETGGFVTEAGTSMTELGTATDTTGTSLETLNTGVETTNTGLTEMTTGATDTGTAMTDLSTATDTTNTALETSNDALGQIVPSLADTATGAADSAQGFSDLAPPIEDTNTALDSSSGLLEGVSPLLADTGTNAGDAAATTGEFSGALGGLNDELGPVNGGLTESNTLVGDLGTEAGTTAGQTDTLKGSMSTLAFGITTVVGAGYGLVNSFLGIRDAGFKVDRANIMVEKSSVAVDKALFGISKTIRKLATDSEAPIQGLGRLNSAFVTFNGLVQSGVTSGPQYTAALNNLKTAAEGLHGSTVKDNEAIQALQNQISGAIPKISTLDLNTRKQTKANEGMVKSFIDAGMGIATFVGGMGSMVQTLTSGGAALGTVKTALAGLGSTLSATVLPALGAIAVPVGIAVAAVGAFIGAVTAIRANLKVFDDLGMKVGEVFPEMKGFLEDARQGFINLSDGINSAISFILGGIDSFAGGTTNLKSQWEGFTGTLPKGTGEMGIAGQAMRALAITSGELGETIKVGANKWKEADGVLMRLNGSVLASAGNWTTLADGTAVYLKSAEKVPPALDQSTTAMDAFGATAQTTGAVLKEQTANYSELTNAQQLSVAAQNRVIEGLSDEKLARFNAITEAEKYLVAHGTTAKAVGLSGDVLIGYVNSLKNEGPAYSDSVQKATEYIATKHKEIDLRGKSEEWILKTAASLEEEDKALGKVTETTAKHIEEITKLKQAHTDATAEILYYSDATNMANRMQLEFQAGIDNANLKLIDQQGALANNAGELQRQTEQLGEGVLLEVSYAEGVLQGSKAIVEKSKALAAAIGNYDATNALLEEGTVLVLDWMQGFIEAKAAVQKHTEELSKAVGALAAWNDEATRTKAQQNAALQGWVDQKQAVQDASLAYFEAAGKLRALEEGFGSARAEVLRLNTGILTGAANAIEWYQEIETAKGEAGGFKSVLVGLASQLGTIPDAFSQSTEQLQRFIGVMRGAPDAVQEVVDGIGDMAQTIIDRLSEAGEEGKNAFSENMQELEAELRTQFSAPVTRAIELAVNMDGAKKQAETALGTMATIIEGSIIAGPEIQFDTAAIQAGARELMAGLEQTMAEGGPRVAAGLQPVHDVLQRIASTDFNTAPISTVGGILADMLTNSENLTQSGLQPLVGMLSSIPSVAAAGAEGFAALDAAIASTGFSVTSTGQIINDATGQIVGDLTNMSTGAQDPLTQLANSILGSGQAATAAKVQWATEMQEMKNVIAAFVVDAASLLGNLSVAFQGMAAFSAAALTGLAGNIATFQNSYLTPLTKNAQSSATTISGAFSNMAANTRASMNTMASGITIIIASFTRMGTDAQRGATTVGTAFTTMGSRVTSATNTARSAVTTFTSAVTTMASTGSSRASSFSSAFSSAMSRVSSSASSAASSVRSLQSAINSLQSKTVTITTIYRRVVQTVYAAKGGAFIASSPMDLGGVKVSEFGQKELVTVTPLENPGGQTLTGPGMQVSTSGPGAKAFARSGDKEISLGGGPNGNGNGIGIGIDAKRLIKEIALLLEEKVSAATTVKGRVMKVEQPQVIILKVGERELTRIINKNLFEGIDSLT